MRKTETSTSYSQPSPIRAMSRKANALSKDGFDIINATVGEPNHRVSPEAMDEAIVDMLKVRGTSPRGKLGRVIDRIADEIGLTDQQRAGAPYSYTDFQGDADIRGRIAKSLASQLGQPVEEKNIVLSAGGANEVFNLALLVISEKDETVLMPKPYFASYKHMIKGAGRKSVEIETADEGYIITGKALREACLAECSRQGVSPAELKATFLHVSPANPTGAVTPRAELEAIAEVMRDFPSLNVIDDAIYREITFGKEPFVSLKEVAPDLSDRIAWLYSVSKGPGAPSMRIGMAATEPETASAMANLQLHRGVHPTRAAQEFMAAALEEIVKDKAGISQYYGEKVTGMVEKLRPHGMIKEGYTPEGGFYLLIDLEALKGQPVGKVAAEILGSSSDKPAESALEVAALLLGRTGVATVPASAFGVEGLSVRAVLTGNDVELGKMAERLIDLVSKAKAGEVLPEMPPRKALAARVEPVTDVSASRSA